MIRACDEDNDEGGMAMFIVKKKQEGETMEVDHDDGGDGSGNGAHDKGL